MKNKQSFILWLARRMRLNPNANSANATGAAIAVAGVALALAIMECTIAVVTGFQKQITERIIGFDGQISVMPAYDPLTGTSADFVQLSDTLYQLLETLPGSGVPQLKMQQPGILKTEDNFAGMYFVAYNPDHDYDFEKQSLTEGVFPDFSDELAYNSIVVSSTTADNLELNVGDKVFAYFIIGETVKSRRFVISGIYNTGFSDYDKTIVFASMPVLQSLSQLQSDYGTQIQVNASTLDNIEVEAGNLQNQLIALYHTGTIGKLYPVDNVKHTGAVFFNWLQLLDTNVIVIFILMACVAAFTLISSMFILILDRIPTIGLLRALGATQRQIRLVFATLAMKIVGAGMLIGNVIGLGILLCQQYTKFISLNPEMYYLPAVPVDIQWWHIIVLNCCVVIVSLCVLLIPAGMAGRISPATSMRFD